jgi:hypothetical protein
MLRFLLILVISIVSIPSFADDGSKSCSRNACAVGETVTTYATKSDPYYACATQELSEYTNFLIGLASAQYQLTGTLPNISPKTGEPEYLDDSKGPNMTRVIIEKLRSAAKVSTFDQAVHQCMQGRAKVTVTVMNIPKDSMSFWVFEQKAKRSYWMPKGNLDKK